MDREGRKQMRYKIFLLLGAILSAALIVSPAQAATWDETMNKMSNTNVFFGHQSVGANILDGVEYWNAKSGLPSKTIEGNKGSGQGWLANAYIGSNGDPESKINDFANQINEDIDVAVMKLCYVDVVAGVDPQALFNTYKNKMDYLESKYPTVTFLHATAPLTTTGVGDNRVRKAYNNMIRKEYGSRVFDIARIESTSPNGQKVGGSVPRLYKGYSSDGGHLNDRGARKVAKEFLRVIARVS